MSTRMPKARIAARVVLFVTMLPAILLGSAGTIRWTEAWLYTATYLAFAVPTATWLGRHNPALLEDRMTFMKPTVRRWDKALMLGALPIYAAFLVVPGLDAVRFRWTDVPAAAQAVAFAAMAGSLAVLFLVMRENTFLSRVVEVQRDRGHRVISTGPYAVIRHPMYAAVIVLYLATPLALGSLWGILPAAACGGVLVLLLLREEETLNAELDGYADYTRRVRHRLCPGVW
jgi:protein-S-isoprenylcysteine O-methyltransferase Ste14